MAYFSNQSNSMRSRVTGQRKYTTRTTARKTAAVNRVKAAYGARPEMQVAKGDHMSSVMRTMDRKKRNAANSSSKGTNRGIGKELGRPKGANNAR